MKIEELILSLNPTIEEVKKLIDRNQSVMDKWKGNPDYVRGLMIEQTSLRIMSEVITYTGQEG